LIVKYVAYEILTLFSQVVQQRNEGEVIDFIPDTDVEIILIITVKDVKIRQTNKKYCKKNKVG